MERLWKDLPAQLTSASKLWYMYHNKEATLDRLQTYILELSSLDLINSSLI